MSNKDNLKISDDFAVRAQFLGTSPLPETVATTMAYIPFQTDTTQYTPETALRYGTLFPNLNKPFTGGARK